MNDSIRSQVHSAGCSSHFSVLKISSGSSATGAQVGWLKDAAFVARAVSLDGSNVES